MLTVSLEKHSKRKGERRKLKGEWAVAEEVTPIATMIFRHFL